MSQPYGCVLIWFKKKWRKQGRKKPSASTTATGTDLSQLHTNNVIPSNWILLDIKSTVNVFKSASLLTYIRDKTVQSKHPLQCWCHQHIPSQWSPGVWTCMVPPTSHLQIDFMLLLTVVREWLNSTQGRWLNNCLSPVCLWILFLNCPRFLPGHHCGWYQDAFYSQTIWTSHKCTKTPKTIGRPSTCNFLSRVNSNFLPNCRITCQDTANAKTLFDPDVWFLKGKTSVNLENTLKFCNPRTQATWSPPYPTWLWAVISCLWTKCLSLSLYHVTSSLVQPRCYIAKKRSQLSKP